MKRIGESFHKFFLPPAGAPRWVRAMPYLVLGAGTLLLLIAGAYGWDYTNSPEFCGTACHTMPPEYAAYQISPHARIACVECHIGREFIGNQVLRKAGDVKHIVALAFTTYEFPIRADDLRPARETCERCHSPEKFSDDSLREIKRYGNDLNNTPTSIYLTLKTGGGVEREGLGRGIHWHIQNRIEYYATDKADQTIPYVRVYNADGATSEYIDVTSDINPAAIPADQLEEMDCTTCHNRITHLIYTPEDSLDRALARGTIDANIPEIRLKGAQALTGPYDTQEKAMAGIAGLEDFYQRNFTDYYAANSDAVKAAITVLQEIYNQSVFIEQKADWNSHPNNVGHKNSPGCFRCHDGKHLNADEEAIRLECNVCHSIPVVAQPDDFLVNIEISRGPEPDTHKNSNWIAIHRHSLSESCALCHNTDNPGGTDDSSFCSNSACHGSAWTYAGLNAPALTEIILAQIPPPEPTQPPPTPAAGDATPTPPGPLTYEASILPMFKGKCDACHGGSAAGGLNVTTYATLMQGGKDGAVIKPNDSAGSKLIEIQSAKHFANLTADQLGLVRQWIEAGAPEK